MSNKAKNLILFSTQARLVLILEDTKAKKRINYRENWILRDFMTDLWEVKIKKVKLFNAIKLFGNLYGVWILE